MQAIVVEKLFKRYHRSTRNALSDVSLSLDRGVFGLLGPNGAGKTTLMRVLAALISPTSGNVLMHGYDVEKEPSRVRPLVGFLPQEYNLYPHLNAREFLSYMGLLSNVQNLRGRIEEVLTDVGLQDVKNNRIRTFSGGMRKRLAIAQALIHDPPILLVDEPTAGLDPTERVRFRNLLSELGKERTVLLSTHIVDDVAAASKQIAILKEGKIIFWGDAAMLVSYASGKVWEANISSEKWERFIKTTSCYPIALRDTTEPGFIQVRFLGSDSTTLDEAKSVTPTVEDAYHLLISGVKANDESP